MTHFLNNTESLLKCVINRFALVTPALFANEIRVFPSEGHTPGNENNSLMMIMCFPSFFFFFVLQRHSSTYDWLTSLLIPSYHFTTSFWKKVHGVGLLENNIALLVSTTLY